MVETIKTRIHFYNFYLGSDYKGMEKSPDWPATNTARKNWQTLKSQLKSTPDRGHCMHAFGNYAKHAEELNGVEIELETTHIFDNQWSTAPIPGVSNNGLRVFDWANSTDHATTKSGHYLDITPEMVAIRNNTFACGYCGKQTREPNPPAFCPHCIDSEYLEETNLRLTRMQRVSDKSNRAKLTAEESSVLLPKYRDAQLHGSTERGKARLAKQRADIKHEMEVDTTNARTKHDGLIWLLDAGLKIDNVIYCDHTGKFAIGWRNALSDGQKAEWKAALEEFPFDWEFSKERM